MTVAASPVRQPTPARMADSGDASCDVLVLGEANPDLILRGDVVPRFGQSEQLLDAADLVIGGSGAITAHALARLGVRVRLLGAVGDDQFGRFMTEALTGAGVDCSAMTRSDDPTGLSVVLSDGPSRATLTLIGAIDAPPPAWSSPADLPTTRHLHVSSYFLQHRRAAALPVLLTLARAAGITVSLDTNLDPTGAFTGLAEVLPHVTWLLPNADEAMLMAAGVTGRAPADLVDAARSLAAYGPTVVVKDGSRGALAIGSDGSMMSEAGRPVTPVDTTGAGDTFDAGLLAGLLAGHDLREALRWGCAAGAFAVQRPGGTGGQPTRDELLAALA